MTLTQPALSDLALQLLCEPFAGEPLEMGEVEPHDPIVGYRADPRTAWNDAIACVNIKATMPAEWATLVVKQESRFAVPMAAGFYPQMLRDLAGLMNADDLTSLRSCRASKSAGSAIRKQAEALGNVPLAAGFLRTAGDVTAAETMLTGKTDAAAINEQAANAWEAGDDVTAVRLWTALPESGMRSFNLGLAALFTADATKADALFADAVTKLPEGGWRNLAELYQAVAEMRK